MSGQDERRCEQVGKYDDGSTVWHICGDDGITRAVWLPSGILPQIAESQPPTWKVLQRHVVDSNGQVLWGSPEQGQPVEWELSGDKIVGVRLVEGDDE